MVKTPALCIIESSVRGTFPDPVQQLVEVQRIGATLLDNLEAGDWKWIEQSVAGWFPKPPPPSGSNELGMIVVDLPQIPVIGALVWGSYCIQTDLVSSSYHES